MRCCGAPSEWTCPPQGGVHLNTDSVDPLWTPLKETTASRISSTILDNISAAIDSKKPEKLPLLALSTSVACISIYATRVRSRAAAHPRWIGTCASRVGSLLSRLSARASVSGCRRSVLVGGWLKMKDESLHTYGYGLRSQRVPRHLEPDNCDDTSHNTQRAESLSADRDSLEQTLPGPEGEGKPLSRHAHKSTHVLA
eukprot:scaffold222949_cov33-Tisochrysis_lutea.AAC.1